jgi:hypothetical protein
MGADKKSSDRQAGIHSDGAEQSRGYGVGMGYLVFLVLGLLVVAAMVVVGVRNKRPAQGRISSDGTAILREEPSADAPTPAKSVIATNSEVKAADKRTPPA